MPSPTTKEVIRPTRRRASGFLRQASRASVNSWSRSSQDLSRSLPARAPRISPSPVPAHVHRLHARQPQQRQGRPDAPHAAPRSIAPASALVQALPS